MNRMTGEEFLQSKDIWNHPNLTDRNNKESYDVAELLEEYATGEPKRQPLADGTLELTDEELSEFIYLFYPNTKTLKISASGVFILSNAEKNIINNYKAILWLAEKFQLTSNN